MIFSFLVGVFFGAINIGAQTTRVTQVLEGKTYRTLISSTVMAFGYYFSVAFIVNQNLSGYLGFSIGAAGITMYLAHKKRVELDKELKKHEEQEPERADSIHLRNDQGEEIMEIK